MRVAVVQVAYGDDEPVAERVDRVAAMVRGLAGHDLVLLPELWAPTGFGYSRWEEYAEPLDGPFVAAMASAARDAGLVLHAGSFVERLATPGVEGRRLANTSVVLGADGALLATYRKIHRFGFGAGEPALFEAGEEVVTLDVTAPEPVRLGLSTCYDLRFPELYRRLVDAEALVLLVPAAWPAARVGHWSLLGRARAVESQCVVIAANTAGTHGGARMGGRSQVVAANGDILAEAGEEEQVLSVEVDLGAIRRWREDFPVLADRRL